MSRVDTQYAERHSTPSFKDEAIILLKLTFEKRLRLYGPFPVEGEYGARFVAESMVGNGCLEFVKVVPFTMATRAEEMANALRVILTDPKLSTWLRENDPKAFEQAHNAVVGL